MRDFEVAGLDGWAIQYPVAGFSQMLRWYELLGLVSVESIESMEMANFFNLTITNIMNGVLHQRENDKSWTQPFLELIYKDCNAPGVPQDLGSDSVISIKDFWPKLEHALGSWADVKLFTSTFGNVTRHRVATRLQILSFWALYTQRATQHQSTSFHPSNPASHSPQRSSVH